MYVLCRYIVSDCDSVDVFFKSQHYTKTPEEAAAKSILAGKLHLKRLYNHIFIATTIELSFNLDDCFEFMVWFLLI
jgi:hypothetical protein